MLRRSAMYNLTLSTSNTGATPVSGAGGTSGTGLLSVDPSGVTPRTPEILNSLIAMTNPFESYQQQQQQIGNQLMTNMTTRSRTTSSSSCTGGNITVLGGHNSSTEINSPTGMNECSSPPSVQHTRSQLIKEGLKLTLQTKRRQAGRTAGARAGGARTPSAGEGSSAQDDDDEDSTSSKRSKKEELTVEDEERRRRRRERNKVAATKCRIKKREKTVNLVQESHVLENQNQELKSQIQELEVQKNRLTDMLRSHQTTCPNGAQIQARRANSTQHEQTPISVTVSTSATESDYLSYGMTYPSTHTPQSVPPYMYNRAASTPSSDATSYELMDSPNTYSYDQGTAMYSPPCRTPSDVTEASSPYTRFDLDLKYNRTDIMKTSPYPVRPTMYYGVTKQEVGEDPLLSGLAEGFDSLGDPAFTPVDPHFSAAGPHDSCFPTDTTHTSTNYCRPASISLDTPPSSESLESPGSIGTPGTFQYYGSGPTQECSYSLDNGCMA